MANYDSNYEIAQEISARIGTSPIPFDSVYSICLAIYQDLGGTEDNFDSVYSILLEILPLIDGGVASKVIDDSIITTAKTWSSSKINSELSEKATTAYVDEQIEAVIGAGNSEIDGKETEDFRFVQSLPAEGEDGEQVIIKGDNADTLYKYVSGEWAVQSPDATKLYFDVENEVLYSYASVEHQFVRISMVNTIVVGSNLNTNADLKAIKTVGVYNVVQRLHNATKGDYVKNWTLYVESVDYEEYDKSDSVYQRLVSNYTIQKRTWSATRATNDGWSNFSTYYAGEIKDSTTSKYYTWSSSKIAAQIADAGFGVEIVQSLPVSGDTHTIYFVPASPSGETDLYDEYMYVDSAWEKVGSTRLDLSDYYTKSEVDTLLNGKADVYNTASTNEIDTLFSQPQSEQYNYEIWYTTSNNRVFTPKNNTLPTIVSNVYSNGHGIIKCVKDITSIGNEAFGEIIADARLTSISLPNTITSIGTNTFSGCAVLQNVTLPDSLVTISAYAFGLCYAFTSIVIPNNVTTIGNASFFKCSNLETITIGSGVTSIETYAFDLCEKLSTLNYVGTMAQWNAITKGEGWYSRTPLTVVHCSDGDVTL